MDRDEANNEAINRLNNEDGNTRIAIISCTSHSLAPVGKKFTLTEGSMVLKRLTKMVQHRLCKARTWVKITFCEEAEDGEGVIWWYIFWEHGSQVTRIGLARMVDEWVFVCV
jgi:hypothetical protein